jgi:hypothetical protein
MNLKDLIVRLITVHHTYIHINMDENLYVLKNLYAFYCI